MPTAIAHTGQTAPVGPALAPATFAPFGFRGPVVVEGDGATFQTWVQSPLGVTSSLFQRAGTVVLEAALDSDADADGLEDSGVYVWSAGRLSLTARSGTRVQGLGTIVAVQSPVFLGGFYGGLAINDAGQVLFKATLDDGRGVLLQTGAAA